MLNIVILKFLKEEALIVKIFLKILIFQKNRSFVESILC